MRKLSLSTIFLAVIMLIYGCNSTTPKSLNDQTTDKPVLRVGVNTDYPPIVFKRNNKISGLEADLAREIAKEMQVDLEFVVMDWKQLIPALQDNKIDIIMSGMSITQLRSMRVVFTNPYLNIGQLAMVRSEDAPKYPFAKAIQLLNDKIGVKKGTTGELFVQRNCPQAEIVTYETPKKAFNALRNKKIDIMIYDAPYVWNIAAENETKGVEVLPFYLTKEQLAWAVNRQNVHLADSINKIIVKLQKSGQLTNIIKRWLPL